MGDQLLALQLASGRLTALQQAQRTGTKQVRSATGTTNEKGVSFETLLNQERLKFSNHAEQRLMQRGIQFGSEQLDRIASAVDQAAAKGAKDSLVLYRDIAMIVNVPSRTVVTAMDGSAASEHIFTKIDSAVIVS